MRGSRLIAGLGAALLAAGCGESAFPTAPSAHADAAISAPVASSAGQTAMHPTGTAVPFKGTLNGQYGDESGQFPIFHESIAATGTAVHLGQYSLDMQETVNFLDRSATGTFTFTAANGDAVYGSYTGHAEPGPGAVVTIVEDATILGGTARFDGATGHFTINRLFDPIARTTSGSIDDGVISSPGANHD